MKRAGRDRHPSVRRGPVWLAIALLLAPAAGRSSDVRVLRLAGPGDVLDIDPHGQNEDQTNSVRGGIYEGLLCLSWDLSLEPCLAESWSQPDPVTWRFRLRRGVRFHDGTPFTADDVVYSFARVRHPSSNMASYLTSVKEVRRVDDHTVDVITDGPDPILLRRLPYFFVISSRWAQANGAAEPPSKVVSEGPTARRANGTGPFRLVERVPDTRIVLEANPDWWAWPTRTFNFSRLEYRPIANAATRIAALLSGEVDLVYPVPPQDVARVRGTPGLKVQVGTDIRTMYLGFDHLRSESLDMPGSGKNPFQDVRVRRAVYQAIDIGAIHRKVMRGSSRPTGVLLGPGVNGYDAALDVRLPYDPQAARRLLAEAGYPQGFPVTLDCTNDRYVNDEAICQALVPMLSRIGIAVTLNAQTKNRIFEKIRANQTSLYMMGWVPGTTDVHDVLFNLALRDDPAAGSWNCGRYRSGRLEALSRRMAVEMDPARRQRLASEAIRVLQEDVTYVPLHQQTVEWAMRDEVEVKLPLDGGKRLRLFRFAAQAAGTRK
jgi:peptide/nickel transport system substrate-binding protein